MTKPSPPTLEEEFELAEREALAASLPQLRAATAAELFQHYLDFIAFTDGLAGQLAPLPLPGESEAKKAYFERLDWLCNGP